MTNRKVQTVSSESDCTKKAERSEKRRLGAELLLEAAADAPSSSLRNTDTRRCGPDPGP